MSDGMRDSENWGPFGAPFYREPVKPPAPVEVEESEAEADDEIPEEPEQLLCDGTCDSCTCPPRIWHRRAPLPTDRSQPS